MQPLEPPEVEIPTVDDHNRPNRSTDQVENVDEQAQALADSLTPDELHRRLDRCAERL